MKVTYNKGDTMGDVIVKSDLFKTTLGWILQKENKNKAAFAKVGLKMGDHPLGTVFLPCLEKHVEPLVPRAEGTIQTAYLARGI